MTKFGLVFKWNLNSVPFDDPTTFDHLNTRRFLDHNCIHESEHLFPLFWQILIFLCYFFSGCENRQAGNLAKYFISITKYFVQVLFVRRGIFIATSVLCDKVSEKKKLMVCCLCFANKNKEGG